MTRRPSCLYPPLARIYLIRLLFFVQIHTFVTFIWSNHIRRGVTACVVENAGAFWQRRQISVSVYLWTPPTSCSEEAIPTRCQRGAVQQQMALDRGAGEGLGGVSHAQTVLSPQVIKPALESTFLGRDGRTCALLAVCTSSVSQRRAVLKWKPEAVTAPSASYP